MRRAPDIRTFSPYLATALFLLSFFSPAPIASAQVVSSNYTLIDNSWGVHFTTNGNPQTGWLVTSGSLAGTVASVNSGHWVNSTLYYFGYMMDGSFTFNPTTGVWGNTANGAAGNGYLSSAADSVSVSVVFPQAVNVGMMRFYPGGWSQYVGTRYAVSYQQGTNWIPLISLQGIGSGSVQSYIDYTFSNAVTAQNWSISLVNGTGGWQENATFGEVQFFTTTPGNNFWAPTAGGGGSGIWTSNSTNWASAGGQLGSSNISAVGSAYFGGTAGTVDVSGTVSPVAGMRFATDGYVVTNGTISLAANSNVFNQIIADTNVGVRIESVLAGTNGLTKGGSGTVTLNGSNTYTGGTFIDDGTLVGSTSTIRGALNNNGTVVLVQETNATISNAITGVGVLSKTGAWTLTLGGTNTYSGGTLVSGGELAGNADAIQGNITNNAAVTFNQSTNDTYAGAMSGSGSLTKTAAGTLTLSATNTYTGGTLVSGGELAGNADAIQGNITNNSAVTFNQSTNDTYAGAMSGSGSLTKTAAGTLTLSGSNSYAGTTRVQGGSLAVATAASLYGGDAANWKASNIIVSSGASLVLAGGSAGQFTSSDFAALLPGLTTVNSNGLLAGAILGIDVAEILAITSAVANSTGAGGGAITLRKFGNGTLTLTASNSYTGGTLVNAGRLVGDALSIRGALTNNSAVTFDQAGSGTFSNVISGTGSVTKSSAGTLTLSGANNYSGGTLISAGRLEGNTTSLQGLITNNAELAINQTNSATHSSRISGTGSLYKTGTGTLTLSASNSYSGSTVIEAGRLAVTGTNTNSAVRVNSGASLSGSGRIGALTVDGTVAPGNSIGTLNAGSTVLDAGGAYELEMLNFTGTAGTTGWDLLAAAGNLTLSNTIDNPFVINLNSLRNSTTPGLSTNFNANLNYTNTFISYTGSLSGTGFNQNLFTVNTSSFSNTFGGAFRVITNAGGLALTYLASFDPNAPYSWTNGAGGWSTIPGWTNGATPTNGAAMIVQGVGGVSSNNGLVSSLSSLLFSNTSTSATLNGDALAIGTNGIANRSSNEHLVNIALSMAGATTVDAASNNITINGSITGAGGLIKSGQGTLALGGANTYGGGTLISGGRLEGSTRSIAGNVTNNASLLFNQTTNGTFAGSVSGSGALIKGGNGTLIMTAENTYSGATIVESGRLVVNGTNANSTVTVESGASLSGTGSVGGGLIVGGLLAPGNSVGTLTAGNTTFDGGGAFELEVFDWVSSAGTGWDLLAVNGDLTLNATTNSPFTIHLVSLQNTNTPGLSVDWNQASSFTNTFVTYTGSLLGTAFSPGLFVVDTTGFQNSFDGTFGVTAVSGGLALFYTPVGSGVPEPGTWAAAALLAGGAAFVRWRKNRTRR